MKKRVLLIAFLLITIIRIDLYSQSGIFTRSYGYGSYNEGFVSLERADSGFLVLARSSALNGNTGLWFFKIDKLGDIVYEHMLSDTFNLISNEAIMHNNSIYVTGYAIIEQSQKLFLMKCDTMGQRLWFTHLDSLDWSFGEDLVFQPPDKIFISGSGGNNPGYSDALFVGADTNGQINLVKSLGNANDDVFFAIDTARNNDLILAGYTYNTVNEEDLLIVKINGKGDTTWQKIISNPGVDIAKDIHIDIQGGYFLAGKTESYSAFQEDPLLMTLDETGVIKWVAVQGGTKDDGFMKSFQLDDSTYRSAGYFNGNISLDEDAYFQNCDKNGYWSPLLPGAIAGGYDNEITNHLILTQDSGYLLTGTTESFGAPLTSVFLVKTDKNGQAVIWSTHVQTPIMNIDKTNNNIGAFPVPARDYCTVTFDNHSSPETISLYSTCGKLIINNRVEPGSSSFRLDIQHLKPGTYFVRLSGQNIRNTIRIVKI